MGWESRAHAADLPIVGQPFVVVCAFSTAVIQCQCEAKPVLTLHGKGRVSTCPACHQSYAIRESGNLQIGQVLAREQPGVVS